MALSTATLEVNLDALAGNYRLLQNAHALKNSAAVVKANAYGLGVAAVSRRLWQEGCREFFVATLEEGVKLRAVLPEAVIGIFSGVFEGEEKTCAAHNLTPVLNTIDMVQRWKAFGQRASIVHVDTGMTRLGLTHAEAEKAAGLVQGDTPLIMSHLACANEPQNPKNAEQLSRFNAALALFPGSQGSLANSAGMFLPTEFHFDIGRPGCALYGIAPHEGTNPMAHVATLSAPIIQVRTLDRNESVGYGGTHLASKGSRIAVVALGYADGYSRLLSNKGFAYIAGKKLPVVGRVSMDMVTVDIGELTDTQLGDAPRAEFINAQQAVDDVAASIGTIGYEVFTSIGARVKRSY